MKMNIIRTFNPCYRLESERSQHSRIHVIYNVILIDVSNGFKWTRITGLNSLHLVWIYEIRSLSTMQHQRPALFVWSRMLKRLQNRNMSQLVLIITKVFLATLLFVLAFHVLQVIWANTAAYKALFVIPWKNLSMKSGFSISPNINR